jgi:hypothetical protein
MCRIRGSSDLTNVVKPNLLFVFGMYYDVTVGALDRIKHCDNTLVVVLRPLLEDRVRDRDESRLRALDLEHLDVPAVERTLVCDNACGCFEAGERAHLPISPLAQPRRKMATTVFRSKADARSLGLVALCCERNDEFK